MNDTAIDRELNGEVPPKTPPARDMGDLMGGSSLVADSRAEAAPVKIVKYKHLMTDIETMATHTSNSPLLSFAMVPFNLEAKGPVMGRPLLILPDLLQQLGRGRWIDEKTQKFWADQTPEARAHWADPSYTYKDGTKPKRMFLEEIPNEIGRFWTDNMTGSDAEVWANGIVFDIGNLENLLNMEVPWRYNAARDMRTTNRKLPPAAQRDLAALTKQENAHDPIDDCVWQIWDVWKRYPVDFEGGSADF
jgi:3'-5' exoribonuclease-like protein